MRSAFAPIEMAGVTADRQAPTLRRGATWSRSSGSRITRETMLTVTTAQACVSKIVSTLACIPVVARSWSTGRPVKPQQRWVLQPDPDISRIDFLGQIIFSLVTDGNAYVYVERDGMGRPEVMKTLDPCDVTCYRPGLASPPTYLYLGGEIPAGSIVHVRGMTLPGSDTGIGPLVYGARRLHLAAAEDDYAYNRFNDSGFGAAVPDGILETDDVLTEEQTTALFAAWQSAHAGTRRGPAVLDSGLKYRALTPSASDMQLIQSRQWTAQEVCVLYGVPAHLIGVPSSDTSMTYSNVESKLRDFYTGTLRDWAARIEQAFTALLPAGERYEFDFPAVNRPAVTDRYALHASALNAGWKTIDEVRAEEGLPPMPEPDPPPPMTTTEEDADGD